MIEDDWEASPPGRAALSLVKFTASATMVALSAGAGSPVGKGITYLIKMTAPEKDSRHFDAKHQDALRGGVFVISAWSALEAFIEDFCKGLMQTNPEKFDNQSFAKLTITAAHLGSPEGRDEVWEAIESSLKGTRSNMFDRWETLLGTRLGLSSPGPVPNLISTTSLEAQQIRNLWAHNAGIADAKFVRGAPSLATAPGELVHLSLRDAVEYVSALMYVGIIHANRYRARCGLGAMDPGQSRRQTAPDPLRQAYYSMYA
jgi:hypothetical protein